MFNWFKKLWRYFFPLPEKTTRIDLVADDPRFLDEIGDWKKMRRVYCPRCGKPTQILGTGHINDKVRCADLCGMKGYFDGLYIKWNNTFSDRR